MPGLTVQNYATYPSMPGALRALCPDLRGVITGIRPYARYQGSREGWKNRGVGGVAWQAVVANDGRVAG